MKSKFEIKINCFVGYSNHAPGDIIILEKEDGLRRKSIMDFISDIPEKTVDSKTIPKKLLHRKRK